MNRGGFYEQIKADLGYLSLDTAASSFATLAEQARNDGWSHIEFLARLVGEQASADRDRRLAARLRYARFPYRRRLDDFDFEFQPSVDRKLVEDRATLRFIDENRPVLFLGQPGCGKTHLAVALATVAVEAGYRGYLHRRRECKTLVRAQHDGSFTTKLKTYTAPTVLVIDDVGLLPIGGTDGAAVFFHVVDTRAHKGHPTLVTTNRGLPAWGQPSFFVSVDDVSEAPGASGADVLKAVLRASWERKQWHRTHAEQVKTVLGRKQGRPGRPDESKLEILDYWEKNGIAETQERFGLAERTVRRYIADARKIKEGR